MPGTEPRARWMGAGGCYSQEPSLPEVEDRGGISPIPLGPAPRLQQHLGGLSGNSSRGGGGLLPLPWHLLEEHLSRGPGKVELPSSRRHATLAAGGKGQDSLGLSASPGRASELWGAAMGDGARDTSVCPFKMNHRWVGAKGQMFSSAFGAEALRLEPRPWVSLGRREHCVGSQGLDIHTQLGVHRACKEVMKVQ